MQCDANVSSLGIARGRLIVTTRAITFQCHATTAGDNNNNTTGAGGGTVDGGGFRPR